MHPLHIVNVCFTGRSGLTDYTLSLARALAAHCRSTIVTARDFSYPDVPFDGEVVRLFRRSRHYPVDLLRFLLWAWQTKPDVIVFQGPLKLPLLDGFVARLLHWRGIRMGTTVHDVLPHYPRAWSPLVYRYFYRSFSRLVAHSSGAELALRRLGIDTPITVVPHGVYDIYRISGISQTEARKRLRGLAADNFVLLFFGHVDERKGIQQLLQFGSTLGPDTNVRIVIAGSCGISIANALLRRQFFAAKSDPRFVIIDKRIPFEEVEPLFTACDAVVLPYLEGTTSGVLKLAMAFERPVIASDIGDIPETVPPGAGIVISHKALDTELPAALARLQQSYHTIRANWMTVASRYEWPGIGRRYHSFLSAGLNSNS